MEPDLKDERRLKSLATDELKRLWVEACKSWAPAPDVEPLEVADGSGARLSTRGFAFSSCAGGAGNLGELPRRRRSSYRVGVEGEQGSNSAVHRLLARCSDIRLVQLSCSE